MIGLNRRGTLPQGRMGTWQSLIDLVRGYFAATGADEKKKRMKTLKRLSFQAVVQHFFRDALAGRATVPPDLVKVITADPTPWQWAL